MDNKNAVHSSKTLFITLLFLFFIVMLQLSRMGMLDRNESVTQNEDELPVAYKNVGFYAEKANNTGKIAIIFDKTASDRYYILENFKSFFEKLKISFDYYEADKPLNLNGYELVIPIINDIEKSGSIPDIFKFIEAGGKAYFPIVPKDSDSFISVYSSLGVVERSYKAKTNQIQDLKGIIGTQGEKYYFAKAVDISYVLRLRNDCEVYFTDDEKNPLLWKRQLSRGVAFVSNCDFLSSYLSRGVCFELLFEILKGYKNESFIYPDYSLQTLILERFPSSFEVKKSKVLSEMNITYDKFIAKEYWAFINSLYKQYKIKPTLSYVAAINDNTEEGFSLDISRNDLMLYTREVLEKNGEIAFSGYSKYPLGLKGELKNEGWFKPWTSYSAIAEALSLAKRPLNELYPNYQIKTYVIQQSRISQNVVRRLDALCPGIENLVTSYVIQNSDQTTNDFKTNDNGKFFYTATTDYSGIKWNALNSLNSLGIFSPMFNINEMLLDDAISFEKYKQTILEAFKTTKNYPSLKKLTVTNASNYIKLYNRLRFKEDEKKDGINLQIDNYFNGMSIKIRSNQKLYSTDTCDIIEYKNGLYIAYPKTAECFIKKGV